MIQHDNNDRLASMLTMQRGLQVNTFGVFFATMTTQERVDYIKENVLALTDELHELLAETSWKPWAKSEFINEEKAFSELVDAWHFMMNIMIAIHPDYDPRCLADELLKSYVKKRAVNVQRQEDGYDGQSTKCPNCKRALDDIDATTEGIPSRVKPTNPVTANVYCNGCGAVVAVVTKE